MLMALLPLAGWAEVDISQNFTFTITNSVFEYSGNAVNVGAVLKQNDVETPVAATNYDLYYFDATNAADQGSTTAPVNVGSYQVQAKGKGQYTGSTQKIAFSITKATVTVNIKNANGFALEYNQPVTNKPVIDVANDVTATVNNGAVDVAEFLDINATALAAYSWEGMTVNETGYPINFNNAITLKEAKAGNYSLTVAARNMFITPVTISENNHFTITLQENTYPNGGFTYTAAEQKPTYLVTWDDDNNAQTTAKSLEEGKDFEVKFTIAAQFSQSAPQPTAANFAQGIYFTYDATHQWYVQASAFAENATYYVKSANGDNGFILVNSPIDAANYSVAVWGKGNYDPTNRMAVQNGFTINKAALTIMAIAQTKVYDGVAFATDNDGNLSDAQFSISGLVGNDQNLTVSGLKATPANQANLTDYVEGGFQVTPSAVGATIGVGNTTIDLTTNYTFGENNTGLKSTTWKITKRPVTLTLSDVKMTKGNDFPYQEENNYPFINENALAVALGTQQEPVYPIAVQEGYDLTGEAPNQQPVLKNTDEGAISPDHVTILKAAYGLSYATAAAQGTEGQEGYVAAEPLYNITATGQNANIQIKTYEDAIKAVAAQNPNVAVDNYDVTIVKGDLIVEGAAFTAMPVVPNKVEYSDDFTPSVYAYGENGEATINAENVEFEYEKINSDGSKTAVNGKPVERGNYRVTIKKGTITGTGDFANVEPTLNPSAFSIIQKTLEPNTFAQTVHTGDALTTIGDNVTYTDGKQFKNKKGPKTGETVTLVYGVVANTVAVDANGKITGFVNNANPACITVALAENNEVNANYVIAEDYTKGTLTISNTYDLVLGGEDTEADVIAAANNGSEEVAITFAENTFKMKKQEWYAVVLPFATSAKELVNKFDTYVVVNTLSANSTDQNFKFTLEMGDIPAGKPFIIKPAEALDWGEIIPEVPAVLYADAAAYNNAKGTNLTAEQFAALTDAQKTKTAAIPAHTKYQFTGKTIDKEIHAYGVEGIVTIKGTYESGITLGPVGTAATDPDRVWWLSDTDYQASKIANDWRKPKSKPHTLAPMEAYLEAAEGWTTYAPIITVEDFDGQTTAIKTLNADKINGLNVSEGWYNLNGVKLQSAPTQKGVYINNGKKVIIK